MSDNAPLLSFVVLSYNYEQYIGKTLQSILAQSVQDFEVIVVDDASSDRSREVIRSFSDPRIRLLVNDRNVGGAASYNRAVLAARGHWLVNLDADDWIAPEKCERQLALLVEDPGPDIIGTWVTAVGADDNRLPAGNETEDFINQDYDLNRIETWIGKNPLCRSSTILRRKMHLRIGLDDVAMVRAPDYELWTRALADGVRFGLLRERLTFLRRHEGGVTHGSRSESIIEMAYAVTKNLSPCAHARSLFQVFESLVSWLKSEQANLSSQEIHRLLGSVIIAPVCDGFFDFRRFLSAHHEIEPVQEVLGKVLESFTLGGYSPEYVQKMSADYQATREARDFWHIRAEAYLEARNYFQDRVRDWEQRYRELATRMAAPEDQSHEPPSGEGGPSA